VPSVTVTVSVPETETETETETVSESPLTPQGGAGRGDEDDVGEKAESAPSMPVSPSRNLEATGTRTVPPSGSLTRPSSAD